MEFSIYKEYVGMERSLTMEEMERLHQEMMDEIGKDEDALELYGDLVVAANKYADYRAKWCIWDREEKLEKDSSRTMCHNSLIMNFNMLARFLKAQGKELHGEKF